MRRLAAIVLGTLYGCTAASTAGDDPAPVAAGLCADLGGDFMLTYESREGDCADRSVDAFVSSKPGRPVPLADMFDCALLDQAGDALFIRSFHPTVTESGDTCEYRLVANCAARTPEGERLGSSQVIAELRQAAGSGTFEGTMQLELTIAGDTCSGAGDVTLQPL